MRFGELQPMDSSPGCYGRAWPACEKGRGEFENNPAGSKEGRQLESGLHASVLLQVIGGIRGGSAGGAW